MVMRVHARWGGAVSGALVRILGSTCRGADSSHMVLHEYVKLMQRGQESIVLGSGSGSGSGRRVVKVAIRVGAQAQALGALGAIGDIGAFGGRGRRGESESEPQDTVKRSKRSRGQEVKSAVCSGAISLLEACRKEHGAHSRATTLCRSRAQALRHMERACRHADMQTPPLATLGHVAASASASQR